MIKTRTALVGAILLIGVWGLLHLPAGWMAPAPFMNRGPFTDKQKDRQYPVALQICWFPEVGGVVQSVFGAGNPVGVERATGVEVSAPCSRPVVRKGYARRGEYVGLLWRLVSEPNGKEIHWRISVQNHTAAEGTSTDAAGAVSCRIGNKPCSVVG